MRNNNELEYGEPYENEILEYGDQECIFLQRHTHEYEGSVKLEEATEAPHNHRVAGITGQSLAFPKGNHFHKLEGNTDFYVDHLHELQSRTGPAIPVGNGRHVHFVQCKTTFSEGHRHGLQFATLIDDPVGE